ncbi:hypothetical protein RSAG8_09796, partial [Rhizoctonia solani AG-8 WAC10335]
MTLALSEETLALVQSAHADPDVEKLVEAYEAMELIETQLWITKHVRPDESYFVLNNNGTAGFGKGTKLDFTWGWGPISIDAVLDLLKFYIEADVSVNTYIFGKKKVLVLKGNLKDGVEGSFDLAVASGSVKLTLKNLSEIWVELKVSGPFFSTIEKQFMIAKI